MKHPWMLRTLPREKKSHTHWGNVSACKGRCVGVNGERRIDGPGRPWGTRNIVSVMRISAIGAALAWFKRRKASRGRADDATRRFIGAVPHMVWTAQPDGTVDNCNLRFTGYTGLTAAALTAAGMKSLFEPLDRDHTLAAWHAAIGAGTPFRAETRLRRADGEHRWHLLLAEPTRNPNGTILRWVGSCTDIQDQKNAERVLTVLAEVTQVLSASLDPYAIADALASGGLPG